MATVKENEVEERILFDQVKVSETHFEFSTHRCFCDTTTKSYEKISSIEQLLHPFSPP